jgi:UbiD family decarboxylase
MDAPPLDLRAYLAGLRQAGELVEVEAEVDLDLEAPEIHRRVIAAGGPALLFRRPKGADQAVVSNLFGTKARVERAFGSRPRALIEAAAKLPQELFPPTAGKLWAQRGLLASLSRVGTANVRRAPVMEVAEAPRLDRSGAWKTWKRDGGRFFTLPLVVTQHPELGTPNLGMYRLQVHDERTTGLHAQIGKGAGFHLAAAEALGRPLPVAVHFGGPPALILAAIAPLPESVPEVLLASLLAGRKLRMARHGASALPLFADAEMVLVGEAPCGERRAEGPFGDHYGYYSERHDYPVFACKTVLRRRDAILPATVVGKPRQEDFFLGDFLQELLAPLFPVVMPAVVDLWSYGETGYHSLAAAVVRQRYEREAMVSAFRILGEGQLALTKFLLVTDKPVDLRDFRRVLPHVLERADFRTDLFLLPNLSMDSLDYAGPRINHGSKGVLLGLGEPRRKLRPEFQGELPGGAREARVFCPGCLVLEGPAYAAEPGAPGRLARAPALAEWPLVVLTDDAERAARSTINFLWSTFTRFDPAADVHAAGMEVAHHHAALTPPLVIDARMKPHYPEELFCDEATARLVDRRWKEYFPRGGVEMGDSARAGLDS